MLEYETLSGDEIDALLRGETIVRRDDGSQTPDQGKRSSVPSSGSTAKETDRGDEPDGLEPEPQPGG